MASLKFWPIMVKTYIYIILTENDQLLTMLYMLTRCLHVCYDSKHKYLFYYFLLRVTVVYNAVQ